MKAEPLLAARKKFPLEPETRIDQVVMPGDAAIKPESPKAVNSEPSQRALFIFWLAELPGEDGTTCEVQF